MDAWHVILGIVWFGGLFYLLVSNLVRRYNEKQLYRAMIENPNDSTVSQYIEAFNKLSGFGSALFNLQYSGQVGNDRARQSQGYDVVKESPNVSTELKEKLKLAYISSGVKIR